jgi:hypothetical protein
MIIQIDEETLFEVYEKMSGEKPTNDKIEELKVWIESDVYEWIKDNIKLKDYSFLFFYFIMMKKYKFFILT